MTGTVRKCQGCGKGMRSVVNDLPERTHHIRCQKIIAAERVAKSASAKMDGAIVTGSLYVGWVLRQLAAKLGGSWWTAQRPLDAFGWDAMDNFNCCVVRSGPSPDIWKEDSGVKNTIEWARRLAPAVRRERVSRAVLVLIDLPIGVWQCFELAAAAGSA